MEEKIIDRFYLVNPTENVIKEKTPNCYGCGKLVTDLEAAYVCRTWYKIIILHKRCGDLPTQILHPKHPQHPLHLNAYAWFWCDICLRYVGGNVLGYNCSSCGINVDLACEKISIDSIIQGKIELQHPSHPHHPLTLMRKPAFAFYCDGCGVEDVDMAYICSTCEFMVHKTCVSLPLTLPINLRYHHHHLSLIFTFPWEHTRYVYTCDVCLKKLDKTCWMYFCGDCRFFAHIRCVVASTTTETTQPDSNLGHDDNDGSDVIEFPLHVEDISKELITPFVMREKGLDKIPDAETTQVFSFLFNYHRHHLSLVSESHDEERDEEDEGEGEGAYDVDKLKICDLCVTPISSPPYYECAPCKYFVHSICYFLPKTFSSSSSPVLYGECPETHDNCHKFTLYIWKDTDPWLCGCDLCGFLTNGMVYECEGCKMKVDVKCASLPTSVRHASHPRHKRLVLNRIPSGGKTKLCHGCGYYGLKGLAYCCSIDDCDFALHLNCSMMPASIRKREWDYNHPLTLTFDASFDHPSDFICDFCEEGMDPKKWMYHCRQCDLSFHLLCLKTASGSYRNIKYGRRFMLDGIHPNHPLTFNCVTLKRRCHLCHHYVYDYYGLECASCNYVVCLDCARTELLKTRCNISSRVL